MHRRLALFAVAASLVAAAPHSGAATTRQASFTKHTYVLPGTSLARDYWVYVPATRPVRNRPVVIDLHGCNQTAVQAAAATRFNQLADQRGVIVVYPQQKVSTDSSAPATDGNGIGCWNWFLPEDQMRGSGEPALIAGITEQVVRAEHADPSRVYVEGISAGADMAVILGATYPDIYSGVAALAGCSYETCRDGTGSLTYAAMGGRARVVPMFVENGTADPANNDGLARGLVASWLGADDRIDDGTDNGSVARLPARTDSAGFGRTPTPGSGDPCLHNDSYTCPGGVVGFHGSYPYTVEHYLRADGCELLQSWSLYGMSHAQPDAPPGTPYGDPLGPDITTASYDFFTSARTCH